MDSKNGEKEPRMNEKQQQPQSNHDTWDESPSTNLSPSTSPSAIAVTHEDGTPRGTAAEGDLEQQAPPDAPIVIHGQTNLLPMRQLLVVFSGLSTAMLCSNLNQTM